MCKKNTSFSVQVWFKHYHLKKYEKKSFNQHRPKPLPPAFKCSLRAQKYLFFIGDDTGLYFCAFVYKNNPKQI